MSLEQLRELIDLGAYVEIVGRSLTKDGESKDKTRQPSACRRSSAPR